MIKMARMESPKQMKRRIKKELKETQEDLSLEHFLHSQASAIWHKNHHKRAIQKLNEKASRLARQYEMITNVERLRGYD